MEIKTNIETSPRGGFISIKNYENSVGEIANIVINGKINYGKAKQDDVTNLQTANLSSLVTDKFPMDLINTVAKELITSLTKESTQSKAQSDAYEVVKDGIRRHIESGDLFIFGWVKDKVVLKEGVYPIVNSRNKTLCKNYVKKALDLRTNKFRQYRLPSNTPIV